MNKEFQEKLHLYKEGKLDRNETAEIENEIDKFNAIWDYINDDDKEFLEELRQEMPPDNTKENSPVKVFKRKVNFRIIMMSAITVFSASIIFIFLYFLASRITSSLFELNYKEVFVKREIIVQLAEMFHPQYKSNRSSVNKSLFAQQSIQVYLDNTVGNTKIDETEISVKYSFGKPVRSGTAKVPFFLPNEDFFSFRNHESYPESGFKILENAPQGTKAKIFVEFNKVLTPKQLKENLINQIAVEDTAPLDITPVTLIDSKFVIANPSYYKFRPVYPYDSNNAKYFEGNSSKQDQYENMDDQAHKESLIDNLKLIKDNQELLQAMYNNDIFKDINIDAAIENVEKNGAQYVGMYISADSKELLKLKGNPLIHCIRVENIVVW